MIALRPRLTRIVAPLKALGLADHLLIGGSLAAISGTIRLFGVSVALLAFGALAIVAGVALVIREGRK